MSAIKKDYYDDDDEYDRRMEAIDEAYREADHSSHPISILLECYQNYEEHDPIADAVANDDEALAWLGDYWAYVKYIEHGNESSMEEVGGFKGFARTVTDSNYVDATLDYLIYDDDPEQIDPTAKDLADRLKNIASRYGALSKMKKSEENYDLAIDYLRQARNLADKADDSVFGTYTPIRDEQLFDLFNAVDDSISSCIGYCKKKSNYYASTKKDMKKADFKAEFDKQVAKNRGKEKNRVVKRGKAPTPSNYADDDERARLAEYLENYNGHGGDKSLANAIAEWIYPSSWD